jgi:hypothetical protein
LIAVSSRSAGLDPSAGLRRLRDQNSEPASPLSLEPVKWPSVIEQVGMGAGAHEVQLVTGEAVDQQPVRLDVGVAVALSVASKRMVLVPLR